jgi:pyrroloquinoline quinone (PQQ) biosynthesis protein C
MSVNVIENNITVDYKPRLRHCTFLERNDTETLLMIVGTDYYELGQEIGDRQKFYEVKRYFDGRHTIHEISKITGVPEDDVTGIVSLFVELGLMRQEKALDFVTGKDFVEQIDKSSHMWKKQIGYHSLFSKLYNNELPKEVFIGYILETYHYVKSAAKHISTAIAHCNDPKYLPILNEYFVEEYDHTKLVLKALKNLGISKEEAENAHPIIGTMSLVNMLCEIGREDTLAYLTCTSLFEARKEDYEESKKALEKMASNYSLQYEQVDPFIDHLREDVEAGHTGLLEEAIDAEQLIPATQAHFIVNCMHDLKHSYDQYHDQIIQYYSDPQNYIPRLKVDYFSL